MSSWHLLRILMNCWSTVEHLDCISRTTDMSWWLMILLSDFFRLYIDLILIIISLASFVLISFMIFIFLSWSSFVSPDCLSLSAETFPCCCHHRQSELRRLTLSCHILICFKQWPPKSICPSISLNQVHFSQGLIRRVWSEWLPL